MLKLTVKGSLQYSGVGLRTYLYRNKVEAFYLVYIEVTKENVLGVQWLYKVWGQSRDTIHVSYVNILGPEDLQSSF